MPAVASARRFHCDEAGQGRGAPSFGALVTEADRVNIAADLRFGRRKLHRLIRAYLSERPSESFGRWVLAYADPTGNTAARNVDRERGW